MNINGILTEPNNKVKFWCKMNCKIKLDGLENYTMSHLFYVDR